MKRRDPVGRLLVASGIVVLAVLVVVPLSIAWSSASVMMRPPWYVHPGPGASLPPGELRDPLTDFGLPYEEVAFETDGGAVLRGWLVPAAAARAAVVLAGGGWTDRRSLLALAPDLHGAGYSTLAFDYREHGSSDGSGRGASLGLRESRDVAAAARFVRRQDGIERVAVVGYSLGGAAAILAAGEEPAIDAVAVSSAGTTLRDLIDTAPQVAGAPSWLRGLIARVFLLRIGAPLAAVVSGKAGPLYAVERVSPRPFLLLNGRADPVSPVAGARRLFARARQPKQMWVVDGTAHLDVLDEQSGEVRRRLLEFLDASVGSGR